MTEFVQSIHTWPQALIAGLVILAIVAVLLGLFIVLLKIMAVD